MIVDTSAVIATFQREPMAPMVLRALELATGIRMSMGTYLELSIVVLDPRLSATPDDVDAFLASYSIAIEPVSVYQVQLGRAAYARFGKGFNPRARLNFGDCFAYALARERNEPLLFVGDDFTHTDITPALG